MTAPCAPGAAPALVVGDLWKSFTLHTQGGIELSVLRGIDLTVHPGECVVLTDPSGAGKSTLLRAIYANYRPQCGRILVAHEDVAVDMVSAEPRQLLAVRRRTIGYVSQFLRVIPRVAALEVVIEPLRAFGVPHAEAVRRGRALLARLRIPERLWTLSPVTFSGGEQQRVNLARGFIADFPILLLDEPTASLDAASRAVAVELIREALARRAAIVGTFHDAEVRDAVATRAVTLQGTGDAGAVSNTAGAVASNATGAMA
jgi:alpha-D-ribose 1-methylphosphonate 5-triphosphate synthase subunit PhnL